MQYYENSVESHDLGRGASRYTAQSSSIALARVGRARIARRADRDNAELRQDLKEAEISKAEFAGLLSAQTKQQANASSFTELTFVVLIVTIFSIIPLYSRIGFSGDLDQSDTPLERGGSDGLNPS